MDDGLRQDSYGLSDPIMACVMTMKSEAEFISMLSRDDFAMCD